MNEVIERLWIGDISDAMNADPSFWRICVLENKPNISPSNSTWIPILEQREGQVKASSSQLDVVASIIDSFLSSGQEVLLHCGAGIERSPLAATWYLHKKKGMSLEDAWKLVQKKRPQAQDRRMWL